MIYSFIKNFSYLQEGWPAPALPTTLTIKAIYVVSYSWHSERLVMLPCVRKLRIVNTENRSK